MKHVLLFALFIYPLISPAQWSINPAVNNPICNAVEDQQGQIMVTDGNGGAIITWVDSRSGDRDVYAQRIDINGIIRWTTDGIAICALSGDQLLESVISDANGGAIITWTDNRNGNYDVYAQRVDSNGVVNWLTNGIVVCNSPGDQIGGDLSSSGSNSFYIVWQDLRNGATNSDIYAQLIDLNGVEHWTNNGLSICSATSDQVGATVAPGVNGSAVIAWMDGRNGNGFDIYCQNIDQTGFVGWTTNGIAICSAPSSQARPKIVSDNLDGCVISWEDLRSGNYDIYAQRVDSNGFVQWSTNGIALCAYANDQHYPEIATDNGGHFVIVWEDYRNGATNADIYAAMIDTAGVLTWASNGNSICSAPNNQTYPDLMISSAGAIIIAWGDSRNGTANWDLYAQLLNSSGVAQWPANGVAISTAINNQAWPCILFDNNNSAIISWQDSRNGNSNGANWDIYAQRIYSNGSLSSISKQSEPSMNISIYPNPALDIINFTSNSIIKSITIYDEAGRLVQYQQLNSTSGVLNVVSLTKGSYWTRIETETGFIQRTINIQ